MQIQAFLFPDLGNQTNRSILISNMTLVFLNFFPKNTQINHFWSQIQAFLFFRKILKLEKFEDAAFKYDNIVFKFQPKTTQIKHFWFHIQALFVRFIFCVFFFFFLAKFSIRQIWGVDFQCKISFFKILAQKYPNKAFLVPNLGFFVFSQNFCDLTNSRVKISNMTIFLKILIKNYPEK